MEPRVNSSWIGIHIRSDAGGVQFVGDAMMRVHTPKIVFDLRFDKGKVTRCEVQVYGAAGLMMSFQSTSQSGVSANVHERVDLPVDFVLPITGLAVPFSVIIHRDKAYDWGRKIADYRAEVTVAALRRAMEASK